MGVAQRKTDGVGRFDAEIRARCPSALIEAAEKVAAQNMMSASEFVRRAVFDRVRASGVDPTAAAV